MSENETKGRCRREFELYYADKRVIPSRSEWILADAIDRIAADVEAVKEATLPQTTEERDCAIRERDEARAEVERFKADAGVARMQRDAAIIRRDDAKAEVERLCAELAARPAAVGWLTEVERQTLLYLRSILSSWGIAPNYPEVKEFYGNHLECLDAILDRAGSPPVVEVPALKFLGSMTGREQGIVLAYRDALDAAGMAWKEVPRE